MTREKSPDSPTRLNVKSGKKVLTKTSRHASNTPTSHPKAALATAHSKKDEAHRRRHPLNDIPRRRSEDNTTSEPARIRTSQHAEPEAASQPNEEKAGADVRMVDRVVELEEALATALEKQEALKEELERAKRHWRAGEDTIDELRQEDGYVPQDTPKSLTAIINERVEGGIEDDGLPGKKDFHEEYRSSKKYQVSGEDQLQQYYDSRDKLAQEREHFIAQDVKYLGNRDCALSREDSDWNELQMRLHNTEKESQERLKQLLSLKSSISSLTRTESQPTDSELVDSFTQLFNRIREWTISNFRRTKMDTGNLPIETTNALRSLTPAFDSIEKSHRLALLQALVSNALMQVLEEPLFVGMLCAGPLAALRSFAESMQSNRSEYREWRRTTIRLIQNTEMADSLKEGKNGLLHKLAGNIAHMLFTLTSVNLTSSAQLKLSSILNAAADLQHVMALQKAQYQIHFFRDQTTNTRLDFDDQKMESVNDFDSMTEHDGVYTRRRFLFCVFPCLEKFGDEAGNNLHVGNILLKAKVCCGAD